MQRVILLFLVVLAVPTMAQFTACGNTDTCANGQKCMANICVPADSIEGPNGLANACSYDDCCPGTLLCPTITKRCTDFSSVSDSTVGIALEGCKATGVAPTTSITDNNSSTPDNSGMTGTTTINTGNGTFTVGGQCGNADTCATGLSCYSNICATTTSGAVDGLGNSCSSIDCCKAGLACVAGAKKCTPVINGLVTVTCTATGGLNQGGTTTTNTTTGGTTTTPTTGGTTTNGTTTTTPVTVGGACNNVNSCPTGQKCLADICVSDNVSGQDGLGNTCSATDCCKTGLMCLSAVNKCTTLVNNPLVPIVACTNPNSGAQGTTTGTGGLVGGSTIQNSADSSHTSAFVTIGLAIYAIASIMLN